MLKPEPMCFLIADISGYTEYLAGVELDHAQDILADLIGTVVTSLRPTFRLAKLEGDAAFMSIPAEAVDGSLLLDTIEHCYFGFRRRRRDVRQATSCSCDACVRIPHLDLKFVVHHGLAIRQTMAGLDELIGRDVIVVHRLLKNRVVGETGTSAYALLSQACVDAMQIEPDALGMRTHEESYEHVGEVRGWVHDLGRRWREEEERTRVMVEPEDAMFHVELATPAPPQVVWEFLTAPGRRTAWQLGVTDVVVEAKGNRRGVGATNHCMHGPDAIVEEILDWRPYDYYTDRATMDTPAGRASFLSTTELEPTADGTTVRMRFAPASGDRDRAILEQMAPMLEDMIRASERSLRAALAEDAAKRSSDLAAEPALPSPRPDAPFAGVAPLRMLD